MTDNDPLITRIPADVERPDKVMSGLTARQLAILGLSGGIAALIYYTGHDYIPVPVVAAAAFFLIAAGVAVALGSRDGLSLDRFVLAAMAYLRSIKMVVSAPEGVAAPPRWCRVRGRLPAPLALPVRAIRTDGVLELADGGTAVLVESSTVSFHLRTAREQAALVAAFGRWLNSLDAPVQVLVRARPVDLSALIEGIGRQVSELPHRALEQAAREHLAFLGELNASPDLLSRQVVVVVRDQPIARGRRSSVRSASAAVVLRRAAEAERALTALGVAATVLDAHAANRVLTECLDPGGWGHSAEAAVPDELITAQEEGR